MTKTRGVDEFGNVFYDVRDGERLVGRVEKTCSGWHATFPSGSYVPVSSVRKAMEVLAK